MNREEAIELLTESQADIKDLCRLQTELSKSTDKKVKFTIRYHVPIGFEVYRNKSTINISASALSKIIDIAISREKTNMNNLIYTLNDLSKYNCAQSSKPYEYNYISKD